MLNGSLRILLLAASSVAALDMVGGAWAASDKAEKKRWEELRDEPIDYAKFEKRRAENLKLGGTMTTKALAGGFAATSDLGSMPVITDEAITKALALQAEKLLPEKLGIKGPQIEFIVVDDLGLYAAARAAGQGNEAIAAVLAKEAATFTVDAKSGGAIVVGLSALKVTKSYDELDFLLAHEMSHILYDHFSELETRETIDQILAVGILIASLVTRSESAKTQEAVAWSAVGLIVANGLIGAAWDRSQEYESDGLGYELLLESGMSAEGAMNIFEKLQQRDDAQKAYLDALCGPEGALERIFKDVVRGIGIPIPDKGYDPNNPVCAQRKNLLASLFRKHPEVKDRKKKVDEHNSKFYADLAPRSVTSFPNSASSLLDFVSPNGDANRLVKAYDGIKAYFNRDMVTARRIAREVLRPGTTEVLIPVLELNFYVASEDGKRDEAFRYLDQALRVPQASDRMFDLAVREYDKDKRWGDVVRVLDLRLRRFAGQEGLIYPQLIHYLRLAGQTARVEKVVADCRAIGEPGVILACEAAATQPLDLPGQNPASSAATPPAKPN